MSPDYFGALLRSAGGVTAASPVALQGAGGDLVEHDVEREAPGGPARVDAAPTTRPLRASGPPPSTIPSRNSAALAGRTPPSTVSPDAVPPSMPDARIDTQPRPEPAPPLHAAVQAALSWVAADPQMHAISDPASHAEQPSFAVTETTAITAEVLDDALQGPDASASRAPMHTDAPDASTASDVASQRRAEHLEPALAHDDVVEISIGAIHLRVDAPTPQTTAAPAAAAPLRTPTPRSSLSRRALYRL